MCENIVWKPVLWLTNKYLERTLKEYLDSEQVQVIKFDMKPATSNGDNYGSIISRVNVQFHCNKQKTNQISFIMKSSYEGDTFVKKIMIAHDVCNTEMKMYGQILPQLVAVLKQIDDDEQLFASTLKIDDKNSAILLEDLAVHNYVLADRLKGLNVEEARFALTKLAKFHASSLVVNQRRNGQLKEFQRGIFNRHAMPFKCFFELMIQNCAEFAKNIPELGVYYHDKLLKLKPQIVAYGITAYHSNTNKFFVLNHGDLWINNMMIQYDEQKHVKDILLIDFQLCNWASPAVDLHYFFNTSLEPALQLNVLKLDELVQYYHRILSETVTNLNYSGYVPTLDELRILLREGEILALTSTICNQAMMINDQCNDDVDLHTLAGDDERSQKVRASCFRNQRFQDIIKTLLPYFDKRGLLDMKK